MGTLRVDIELSRRDFRLQVALDVAAGETVALLGPSGAGKSSLLRCVAGLERAARGLVAVGEQTWLDTAARVDVRAHRRATGYVPQDYGLFPHMTVAANVRFASRGGVPADLLDRLAIADLRDEHPRQLSGGERQRVALARALARDPDVLLLDEPLSALDASLRGRVRRELREELVRGALPSLLVTHAFDEAAAIADRVGVIDSGRLVQIGSPDQLQDSPQTATVAGVTGAILLDGVAEGSLVRLEGGGELRGAATADGPVTVALHPWHLRPVAAAGAGLTETVVAVRNESGSVVVDCERLSLRLVPGVVEVPAPGTEIGVDVQPRHARVFPRD